MKKKSYPFIKNNLFLSAVWIEDAEKNGEWEGNFHLRLEEKDENDLMITIDRIFSYDIHTIIRDGEENELRSLEWSKEEEWIKFKSWTQGISKAGLDALLLQSNSQSKLDKSFILITHKLMRFVFANDLNLIFRHLQYIEKVCVYESKPHQLSLKINLFYLLKYLVKNGPYEDINITKEITYHKRTFYVHENFDEILEKIIQLPISAKFLFDFHSYFGFLLEDDRSKKIRDWNKFADLFVIVDGEKYWLGYYGKNCDSLGLCIEQPIRNIREIQLLENHRELEYLDLRYNEISSIENFPDFLNLKHLSLFNNQIASLSGCEKYPKLQILNVTSNYITEISNIDNLQNLQTLGLNYNKIQVLNNLPYFQNLKNFDIGANKLESLNGIENVPNLRFLRISSNSHLKTINNLKVLKNLKELDLSDCFRIEDFSIISELEELEFLDVMGLQLESKILSELPKLNTLHITADYFSKAEIELLKMKIENVKLFG